MAILKTGCRKTGEGESETLSLRELQCLMLAGEGLSNKMIAERLGIADGTIKAHIHHVLAKLEAGDRTHAVVRAIQEGYLTVELTS